MQRNSKQYVLFSFKLSPKGYHKAPTQHRTVLYKLTPEGEQKREHIVSKCNDQKLDICQTHWSENQQCDEIEW